MKKQALFLLLFCVSFSVLTQAQVIYSDDFANATVPARLSSGTGSGNGYDGWNSNSSFCAQGGFCSS
jgi:hypothetical protein